MYKIHFYQINPVCLIRLLKSNLPHANKSLSPNKIPEDEINPELAETDQILLDAIKTPKKSKLPSTYKKSLHNKSAIPLPNGKKSLVNKNSVPKSAIPKNSLARESKFPMPKESVVNKSKIPQSTFPVQNTIKPNQKLDKNSFIPGQVRSVVDINQSNFVQNPFSSNNPGYGNSSIPYQSGLLYSIAKK